MEKQYVCACVYMCMHVCVYVYMYVQIILKVYNVHIQINTL